MESVAGLNCNWWRNSLEYAAGGPVAGLAGDSALAGNPLRAPTP